jgi:hypothetical protein
MGTGHGDGGHGGGMGTDRTFPASERRVAYPLRFLQRVGLHHAAF